MSVKLNIFNPFHTNALRLYCNAFQYPATTMCCISYRNQSSNQMTNLMTSFYMNTGEHWNKWELWYKMDHEISPLTSGVP